MGNTEIWYKSDSVEQLEKNIMKQEEKKKDAQSEKKEYYKKTPWTDTRLQFYKEVNGLRESLQGRF